MAAQVTFKNSSEIFKNCSKNYKKFQVALKRQQASEDAIALGLRMQQTVRKTNAPKLGFLAPGPVFPSSK